MKHLNFLSIHQNSLSAHLHHLCTLLFAVAVLLFFGLAYPHHLHYQEAYQLFLFDTAYAWEIIRYPGGLADWLGRFSTQFFLFAWVGALIIALLLSSVQLLVRRQAEWGWLYGLTFVPSFLLWLFLLDEHALLGGVWAVMLTLFASWAFGLLAARSPVRGTLLVVAVPVLYWVSGPVSVLFFILQAPHPKRAPWYYALFILLALMPLLSARCLSVPAASLWTGVHYYRYPSVVPSLLWLSVLSVFLISFFIRLWPRLSFSGSHRHRLPFLIAQVSFLLLFCLFVWKSANFKAEKVMHYDFMACHQQWNRILETISSEKPNNQIGVTVQNLALAMRGRLVYQLFDYNQNGIAGLLPDVQTDATSPMATAEVFYHLGMTNIAQRTVFEAQEAILDYQKSGRCYKRLAQTNLINGHYAVARKYLIALTKTLFYRQWAHDTLLLLGDEEAINKHPEYGRLRQFGYKEDFFFSDHITSEMLQRLFLGNTDNRLAYEYLMAYCLLTGDREGFTQFLEWGRSKGYPAVPRQMLAPV